MPVWLTVTIGIAAALTAIGVIWRTVVRPGAQLITLTEQMLPVLRQLTADFSDAPTSLAVLREVADEFRADAGSTLRDAIDRIEAAANEQTTKAQKLAIDLEVERQLAIDDRQKLTTLIAQVEQLVAQVHVDRTDLETHIVQKTPDHDQ